MHLAAVTAPATPGIQAELPFVEASGHYQKALKSLEFPPNARVDVRAAMSTAIAEATTAVELLTPYTESSDMFVGRNAKASVESAKTGVSALQSALGSIDVGGPAGPQIPVSTFLKIAAESFHQADSALFWE